MNNLFPENSYLGSCSCGVTYLAPKGTLHCSNCLYKRIAELEKGYEELTIATLNAVQCMSGGKCKAALRDAYDKAVEQLKEQGE